jgi:hypothetical protein
MPETGSEFIIKLNGIKLPPDAEARIEKAIRGAVMHELARTDLKGDTMALIPKRWLGLWLDIFRQGGLEQVPNLRVTDYQK